MTEDLVLFIESENILFDLHVVYFKDGDVLEVDFAQQLVYFHQLLLQGLVQFVQALGFVLGVCLTLFKHV
jgi:hypothetical protein